jgi:predicted PurR-regulated permease PerM
VTAGAVLSAESSAFDSSELMEPSATRGPAQQIVAALLIIAGLWLAQSILVPIVMGILLSYALDPLSRRLTRWGCPTSLAAAVTLSAVLVGAGTGLYALRDQATILVTRVPEAAQQLRHTLESRRLSGPTTVDRVQHAAEEIQQIAAAAATSPAPAPGVARVRVETPGLQFGDLAWRGWVGALELSGQALLVLFLAYYLLAAGDLYKRKIVKIAGPSLAQKKITVEILNQVDRQIEKFLVMRVLVSAIVGVATALAFWALGLGEAAMWGLAAGVLNIIPYIGAGTITIAAAITAYLQFGTLSMAAIVALVSMGVASVEGFVITPWLMGRAGEMSPVAMFVGLAFWGWIWGIPGLLLAVPIMMVTKALCDHVESLQFIGELLGE